MKKAVVILAMFCAAGFAQNKTVTIGQQTWMAENLNIEVPGSKCYNDNSQNCGAFGKLYSWDMAKIACPAGSHLPSDAEWRELIALSGTSWKLRAKTGWNPAKLDDNNVSRNINGTDDYGFAAIPAGVFTQNGFSRALDFGYWYTSTEINAETARVYYIGGSSDAVSSQDVSKQSVYASVRCLIDNTPPAPVVVAPPAPVVAPPAPVVASAPEIVVPEPAATQWQPSQSAPEQQSIPTNIATGSESSSGGWVKPVVSIGLAVAGLGAIAYGVLQDKEVANAIDRRSLSDAEDAEKKRNIGYIAGGVLLASGITIFFVF
ncbi:MAG: hypothetical protein FWC26_07905 [Fibromonadales bacterium]|nr:hypothetical protein [Fibromonadales bacterium]